jgi:hypothetical protein
VCLVAGPGAVSDVDRAGRLVEQSLVSVHMTAHTVRYYLLESLRLFAEDRLAAQSTEHSDEPAR